MHAYVYICIFFTNNYCYCMHICIYVYSLLVRFTIIAMYYCFMYVYYSLTKTTVIVCICPYMYILY